MTNPNGTQIAFTYDADGNRISKAVTSGSTTTTIKDVYALGRVDHQTDDSGTILATFTYDAGGAPASVVVGSPASGPRYYYVYNGHGDVVALTDSSGNVVASYAYDAFGVLTSSSESFPGGWSNPYRYDGGERVRYDAETGLYWMSVRAYDPTLGRFISHDPLGRLAAMGLDTQPYVYVSNNPVNWTDPSGLLLINRPLHDGDSGAAVTAKVAAKAAVAAVKRVVAAKPAAFSKKVSKSVSKPTRVLKPAASPVRPSSPQRPQGDGSICGIEGVVFCVGGSQNGELFSLAAKGAMTSALLAKGWIGLSTLADFLENLRDEVVNAWEGVVTQSGTASGILGSIAGGAVGFMCIQFWVVCVPTTAVAGYEIGKGIAEDNTRKLIEPLVGRLNSMIGTLKTKSNVLLSQGDTTSEFLLMVHRPNTSDRRYEPWQDDFLTLSPFCMSCPPIGGNPPV